MPTISLADALALAARHVQDGRLEQAQAVCNAIIAEHSDQSSALHLLGVIAHARQDHARAMELLDRAVALEPGAADYHSNRGSVLLAMKRIDEAIAEFRRAIELAPDYTDAHFNLGLALMHSNQLDPAIESLKRVTTLRPDSARAHASLGDAFWKRNDRNEAAQAYQRAVQLDPNYVYAWINLGMALQAAKHFDRAMQCIVQANRIDPKSAIAVRVMGNLLQEQGELENALTWYRRALELNPNDAEAHSAVLARSMRADTTRQSIGEEYARWSRRHAEPLMADIRPHANTRDLDRRLRIGYFSSDFFNHPLRFFLEPVLKCHDHDRFEIHAYANVKRPDTVTARLRKYFDVWQDIFLLSDDQAAERIREDRIDLLIHLTMHASNNRLLILAQKPAPVQAAWLAYAGTTGLPMVDYRITDRFIEPDGQDESWAPERPWRLPNCWCSYDPDTDAAINDLPAKSNGFVTFGSLSTFRKINRAVLTLWARLMRETGYSRLILACPEGSHRQRLLDFMQSEGIGPDRIRLQSRLERTEYLKLHNEIDIALDPFSWSGNTTSCDALWMGVPVLTLPGDLPVSRQTFTLISSLGLPELAGKDPDHFIEIGKALAHDLPRLVELRSSLREKMRESPITNSAQFTKDLETAFRDMWRRWCISG